MHSLIEFFVFPVLAGLFLALIGNPMKWPGARRLKALSIVIALAVLSAFGWNATKDKPPPTNVTTVQTGSNASTTGSQSPAVTGSGNTVNYGSDSPAGNGNNIQNQTIQVNSPNNIIVTGGIVNNPNASGKRSIPDSVSTRDKPAGRTADQWFVGDWDGYYNRLLEAPAVSTGRTLLGGISFCQMQETTSADLTTQPARKGLGTGVLTIEQQRESVLGKQSGCYESNCRAVYDARFKLSSDFGGATVEAILRRNSQSAPCGEMLTQTLAGTIKVVSDLRIRLLTDDGKVDLTLDRTHW